MHTKIFAAVVSLWLVLTAPSALAAAQSVPENSTDGHGMEHRHPHHHHSHPQVDWSAAPADVRALKAQLDQLRMEQKGLYEQMRQQRDQIKAAHHNMSDQKRASLKGEAKELMTQLYGSSKSIHALREKSHAAWDQFFQHSQSKNWNAAKKDMQSILALKHEVIAKQKDVVKIQQRLVELMKK